MGVERCHLLNLVQESTITVPKPKRTLLPVLVVLFIASYGIMTMLIVEQGKTIDVQRYLIGEMVNDTSQLGAMKSAAIRRQAEEQAKAKAAAEASSTQASPGNKKGKLGRPAPLKPPKATADSPDVRRNLIAI
jgi:hypothetical protein